jgi:hypothetical protein
MGFNSAFKGLRFSYSWFLKEGARGIPSTHIREMASQQQTTNSKLLTWVPEPLQSFSQTVFYHFICSWSYY